MNQFSYNTNTYRKMVENYFAAITILACAFGSKAKDKFREAIWELILLPPDVVKNLPKELIERHNAIITRCTKLKGCSGYLDVTIDKMKSVTMAEIAK